MDKLLGQTSRRFSPLVIIGNETFRRLYHQRELVVTVSQEIFSDLGVLAGKLLCALVVTLNLEIIATLLINWFSCQRDWMVIFCKTSR